MARPPQPLSPNLSPTKLRKRRRRRAFARQLRELVGGVEEARAAAAASASSAEKSAQSAVNSGLSSDRAFAALPNLNEEPAGEGVDFVNLALVGAAAFAAWQFFFK